MVPHDVVHLGTEAFHATVVGLPWQLGELLTLIEEVRPGLKWYVADVQAVGPFPLPRGEKRPTWVGDAKALAHAVAEVEQFESGVFVGVPGELNDPAFRSGGLWTEDEDAADLGDAVVEVRAFDWTYWSVATNNADILSSVLRRFPGASIAS